MVTLAKTTDLAPCNLALLKPAVCSRRLHTARLSSHGAVVRASTCDLPFLRGVDPTGPAEILKTHH